jgi:DNA polymerase III alpha chain
MDKYINYHCHSYYSNSIIADSPVSPKEYIARIKELGHTTYVSTEHGISFNWAEKYLLCKENNIKFVFGVEAYTLYNEKVYHIMFVAKNKNGMIQLNKLISDAVINNFKYSRPRVKLETIKEFINPNDVICSSACIGGLLKEPSLMLVKELYKFFKDNFFLEVAYHKSQKQIEINKLAKKISEQVGIKLIAGNDSHYIYPEQKVLRDELLASRRIVYADEEDDETQFYMDYPDYETMFNRFKEQGIWGDDEIYDFINRTNIIEEFDDITFDNNWKVPTLYPNLSKHERQQLLVDEANKRWSEYKKHIPEHQYKEYIKAIRWELDEWLKCGMEDYLLTASKLVEEGVKLGGVVTMSGRGSASSFLTTTLFGLSTIDRIQAKVPLLPERFMTADRIISAHSTPDYDINVYNREKFIEAQDKLLGEEMNYQLCAYGTLQQKSAFRMLCKTRDDITVEQQLYITSKIEEYERDYKHASDEDRETMDISNYIVDRDMYKIYEQAIKFLGTVTDIKGSPCSWCIANDNLMEIFGLCRAKNGDILLNIEGNKIESFGYLKMDWLIVDAVGIIDAVYKEIGIPVPTSNELYWLIQDDKATWDIYGKGITCCVNQCEQPKSKQKVINYKPKSIEELCAFIAMIRPGAISIYDKFEKREDFNYGDKSIDDILQGKFLSSSLLMYQEQVLQLLNYCGFEPKETYDILKAISKKKEEKISKVKPVFFKELTKHIIKNKLGVMSK